MSVQLPWANLNRQTVRAPVNPMDVSTVVSIYPVAIDETKPTLMPGRFYLPAGNPKKPSVLTIGTSSWWKEIDPEQPLLEIPVGSIQIADSIVRDYCNGLLECDMGSAMPGLFYLPGKLTAAEVMTQHSKLVVAAYEKQKRWFERLVNLADVLWSRTNGNMRSVNEMMHMAARELGIEDKEWLRNSQSAAQERCFACGTLKDTRFPVCPACRAIDPNHPSSKDIKFAV